MQDIVIGLLVGLGMAFLFQGIVFFLLMNWVLMQALWKQAEPQPQYMELTGEELAHLLSHAKPRPKTKPYN